MKVQSGTKLETADTAKEHLRTVSWLPLLGSSVCQVRGRVQDSPDAKQMVLCNVLVVFGTVFGGIQSGSQALELPLTMFVVNIRSRSLHIWSL